MFVLPIVQVLTSGSQRGMPVYVLRSEGKSPAVGMHIASKSGKINDSCLLKVELPL